MRRRARPAPGVLAAAILSAAIAAGSSLASCGGGTVGGSGSITLYSGQHPQLTRALVDAFEKASGITVRVRTDNGVVLADELLQEGSASPADVYLTENTPELMLLQEHGLLAPLPRTVTNQIPARYSSPSGNWVGIAVRVSALVYDPSKVRETRLPRTVVELSQAQWKGKIAVAPTDSDFVPLVGALIADYGTAAARHWLSGIKANASLYQDDEAVVAAVNRGAASVGIANQYYWYRLRLEMGSSRMDSALYFFPDHDVGSVENVSGAAVMASSKNRSAANRFVAFLVSSTAQKIISKGDDYEYPAREGVAPNAALEPLASIGPAAIDVVHLGDDTAAATLIQQAGLA